MADSDKKTDWSGVNHALQKMRSDNELPLHPISQSSLPVSLQGNEQGSIAGAEGAPDVVANPQGILAKIKVGAVSRKAGVKMAQVWYTKQLEAVQHRLTEVVRVRNAEATTIAEQMLASINAQHLGFLTELGLRNEDQRKSALAALTDQTAQHLAEAQQRDWPDALRQQYIQGVIERHNAFFTKLVSELGA